MADAETNDTRRRELRSKIIEAFRAAIDVEPEMAHVWDTLSFHLIREFHDTADSSVIIEALVAAKRAVALGCGHYNFACALVLNGEVDEALDELVGCLDRDDVERSHVAADDDWKALHENPRFRRLVGL